VFVFVVMVVMVVDISLIVHMIIVMAVRV